MGATTGMPTWAALLVGLTGLNLVAILGSVFWFGVWKGKTDTTLANHGARLDAHGKHLERHDQWMLDHPDQVRRRA